MVASAADVHPEPSITRRVANTGGGDGGQRGPGPRDDHPAAMVRSAADVHRAA